MKILCVENDKNLGEAMIECMTGEGHEMTHASSPDEARKFLDSSSFDIMLTDLRLINDSDSDDISGVTLTEYAKQKNPAMPVILYSSTLPGPTDPLTILFQQSGGNKMISKRDGVQAMLDALDAVYKEATQRGI